MFVQVAHLAQNALHVAAAFASAGVRHDAVVAEVVASAHDAHKSAHVRSAYSLRHYVAVSLCGRQLDVHRLVSRLGLSYEVGQGEIGVGAGHEVGMMVLEQVFLHSLGHASQHSDNHSSALARHGVQGVEAVEHFLFGIVAHAARVQKHGVGFVNAFAQFISGHLHHRGHNLAVGHVHLAAVGFYK